MKKVSSASIIRQNLGQCYHTHSLLTCYLNLDYNIISSFLTILNAYFPDIYRSYIAFNI